MKKSQSKTRAKKAVEPDVIDSEPAAPTGQTDQAGQTEHAEHAEHGESHGHDHGDGEMCNHDHGGAHCEFELAIRPFRSEDYRELKSIWKAGNIAVDATDSAKALKENIETRPKGFKVFVAEIIAIDGQTGKPTGVKQLAGGVIVTFDGHRAYIYHFAVHPEFRGVGLGGALIETCEHQARVWGAKHLRLMSGTDTSRDGARRLYEKNGWKADTNLVQYKKDL